MKKKISKKSRRESWAGQDFSTTSDSRWWISFYRNNNRSDGWNRCCWWIGFGIVDGHGPVTASRVQFLNDGPQCCTAVIDLDQMEKENAIVAQIVLRERTTSKTKDLIVFAVDTGQNVMFNEIEPGRRQTDSITPNGQTGDRQWQQGHNVKPPDRTDFLVK